MQYIRTTTAARGGAKPAGKTSTLTFRIAPALKEALRTAAVREHRSITNMTEALIRDYCGRNGITILQQAPLREESPKPQLRKR